MAVEVEGLGPTAAEPDGASNQPFNKNSARVFMKVPNNKDPNNEAL